MRGYFGLGQLSATDKTDILDQHKSVYNGYQTMQPQVSNRQPLYVYDDAGDKDGFVVNNRGEIKKYTNMGINEGVNDKNVCESCGGETNEGKVCEECSGGMYEEQMCESCGGETNEGKVCEQCGGTGKKNIQELGGMDDGHPRFGNKKFPNKMSPEEIDDLLRGDEDNDDEDYKDLSMNNPYYGDKTFDDDDYDDYANEDYDDKFDKESQEIKRIDRELGEGDDEEGFPKWEKLKKHMDDRDKKQIDDRNKNINNLMRQIKDDNDEEGFPKWEKLKKHMDDRDKKRDGELGERLYGNQSRIDKNNNNRIDSEDFKMLRKETYELTLNGVNKKFIFNENMFY